MDSRWNDDEPKTKGNEEEKKVAKKMTKKASSTKAAPKKGEKEMAKKMTKKVAPKKETAKKETTKKTTAKETPVKKVNKAAGLTHQKRWEARWKEFVDKKANGAIYVHGHRSLPDGKKLMKVETAAGFEVRLYKDDTYTGGKVLFSSLRSRDVNEFYLSYLDENYKTLPLTGMQVKHGKGVDKIAAANQKATPKKETKKAAPVKKAPVNKPTAKKAIDKKKRAVAKKAKK